MKDDITFIGLTFKPDIALFSLQEKYTYKLVKFNGDDHVELLKSIDGIWIFQFKIAGVKGDVIANSIEELEEKTYANFNELFIFISIINKWFNLKKQVEILK